MKIIDNRNKVSEKSFVGINVGEVFQAKDKQIYMRVCDIYSNFYDEYDYLIDTVLACNAVCLNTGKAQAFHAHDKVIPLKCQCVIEE